jgi:hypothetical protein
MAQKRYAIIMRLDSCALAVPLLIAMCSHYRAVIIAAALAWSLFS